MIPKLPFPHILARLVPLAPWLAMAVVLLVLFGPGLELYFHDPFNPRRIPDDTSISLFHFYHFSDPALFSNDPIGTYLSDAMGDLVRVLYIVAAKLGDPMVLSRALPLILLPITIVGLAVAGRNLAGKAGAMVAMTFCLAAAVVHDRLVGGLPRAFVYPCVAWCAAALTAGRVYQFIAVTIAGAACYPVCAVLGCLALAIWLLLMSQEDRGTALTWSLRYRILVLAVAGAASAAVTAPFALRMRAYGEAIKPDMVQQFPEAGPGGRLSDRDRPPFPPFFPAATGLARQSVLAGPRTMLAPTVADPIRKSRTASFILQTLFSFSVALGYLRLGLASSAARRLAVLAAAAAAGYALADALTPNLVIPQRYVQYTVPILVPLGIAGGLYGLLPRRLRDTSSPRAAWVAAGVVVALAALFLVTLGPGGPLGRRPSYTLKKRHNPVYEAVAKLPKQAVVAGWPVGIMDTLALASRRTPFLTRETHMPYHSGMTLLMRRRMQALIAAYFATNNAPLLRLRDEFGVTHLLVEWSRLDAPNLAYFRPFNSDIQRARHAARGRPYAIKQAEQQAAVFNNGKFSLIDLARLGPIEAR
jgi:hypothetical protein